ncbi:fibroin heavy chain-like, partial [Rhagoletis pomonella]|uniref:fibroin heavy chain-like n=1 Tax=Rhagoletis pomonella TaxID=28610 RepID=UPI00177BF2B5
LSLLLFSAGTWAQSGYNYARPEISNVAGGTTGSSNALRPLVPLGSNAITAPTNAAVGYPSTAGSAYGGTVGAAASPFGGFGAQPTALGATGPTGYSGNTGASTLPVGTGFNAAKRPILGAQQRGGSAQFGGGLTNLAGGQSAYSNAARTSGLNDVDYSGEGDYSAIPGVPAVDYPVYAQVPQTNFDCTQQLPGYYSDVEAQCQVFHICALNRTYSFLCPNGTIFSQETLVCVWWNQFECGTAPALYANNAYIYDYGNEQRNTAGAYSNAGATAQLGARQPANYPGAASGSGLRATSATLPAGGGGIFGAGNLRSTAYGAVPSTATPVPSTAGYNAGAAASAGRFSAAAPTGAQAFNNAVAPIASTQASYGSGVGVGVGVTGGAANSGANSNREYLPPSQQQRRP